MPSASESSPLSATPGQASSASSTPSRSESGGGSGVSVGGMGVSVGGTGVSVGGSGVSVGGSGVSVGGIAVSVGGAGVSVGSIGVSVAARVGSSVATSLTVAARGRRFGGVAVGVGVPVASSWIDERTGSSPPTEPLTTPPETSARKLPATQPLGRPLTCNWYHHMPPDDTGPPTTRPVVPVGRVPMIVADVPAALR